MAIDVILFFPSQSSSRLVRFASSLGGTDLILLAPSSNIFSALRFEMPSTSVILLLERYNFSNNGKQFRFSIVRILLKDKSRILRLFKCEMFSILLTKFW